MTDELTASVVGGGSGGKLSMNALVKSERFRLLAAADINPEVCTALARQFPHLRTFTSHQEMFGACPTDVVCVSTWPPVFPGNMMTWRSLVRILPLLSTASQQAQPLPPLPSRGRPEPWALPGHLGIPACLIPAGMLRGNGRRSEKT